MARPVTTGRSLFGYGTFALFRYLDIANLASGGRPVSLLAVGQARLLRDRFHRVGHDLPATPPGLEGAADDFSVW